MEQCGRRWRRGATVLLDVSFQTMPMTFPISSYLAFGACCTCGSWNRVSQVCEPCDDCSPSLTVSEVRRDTPGSLTRGCQSEIRKTGMAVQEGKARQSSMRRANQ
jgi:hypothetical protein